MGQPRLTGRGWPCLTGPGWPRLPPAVTAAPSRMEPEIRPYPGE